MGEPLPFVTEHVARLAPSSVLDVACGRGRHFAVYQSSGARITGVDRDANALQEAARVTPSAQLIEWDVETNSLPPGVTSQVFDLVVTTFFLYRPLISDLAAVLKPGDGVAEGGHWMLETFHIENRRRRSHPRRESFALQPGEASVLAETAGLEVIVCDEAERGAVFTTRLLARRSV